MMKLADRRSAQKSVRGEADDVRNLLFQGLIFKKNFIHFLNLIFAAFESHEYYRLVDLQQLTKQPPVFLFYFYTFLSSNYLIFRIISIYFTTFSGFSQRDPPRFGNL